jgi:NTP pyrophosphatase (non-canonical NTP hydrolase)
MRISDAEKMIQHEFEKAEHKFPGFPIDPVHAAAVLQEEAGELVQATLQLTYENGSIDAVKKEAAQVGAMAIRFLVNLENMQCRPSDQIIRGSGIIEKPKGLVCPKCLGDGLDPEWRHGSVDDCTYCNGTGFAPVSSQPKERGR